MENIQENEYEVLEKHEGCIKFISSLKNNENTHFRIENISLVDFKQGQIGNCGLIAALGAISQRPEFLAKIVPKIVDTSEGIELQFKMFCKGKPLVVTIDDKIPFFDIPGKSLSIAYASSARNDKFCLASYFEKVFVKQACFCSYNICVGSDPCFVYSLFSDCLISVNTLLCDDLKYNVIDYLKEEIGNGCSVVLSVSPNLIYPADSNNYGHSYVVKDYNTELKSVKLYNQSFCQKTFSEANNNIHSLPISERADPNKGELWIKLDQLEKREVSLHSLYPKHMFKSVFKRYITLKKTNFFECTAKYGCEVNIKEKSKFAIELLIFNIKPTKMIFFILTEESKNVDADFEIRHPGFCTEEQKNGEALVNYYQRFELKPNKYTFQFEFPSEEIKENFDFFLKIGSVKECLFKEVLKSDKKS